LSSSIDIAAEAVAVGPASEPDVARAAMASAGATRVIDFIALPEGPGGMTWRPIMDGPVRDSNDFGGC
jgi:hypothetical protein